MEQSNKEIWKDVIGHEDKCQISNLGRIKYLSWIQANPTRVYKERITKNVGRPYCTASINNKAYTVHRLVAKAFIPNPLNKPEVNHINGIKTDNRAVNLEWATRSENARHAISTGLAQTGERSGSAKLTLKQVRIIRSLFGKMRIHKIAEKFNVAKSTIEAIKHGKTWTRHQ